MIIKKNLKLAESIKLDSILNERVKEIKKQDNIEIMKNNLIIQSEFSKELDVNKEGIK